MNKLSLRLLSLFFITFANNASAINLTIEGPTSVNQGEIVQIKLELDQPIAGPLTYHLGSWQQCRPDIMLIIEAEDQNSQNAQSDAEASAGQAVFNQVGQYRTLFFTDQLPGTDQPLIIWFRSRGGAMCLKDATGKEMQWAWGNSQDYIWRSYSAYTRDDLQGGFSIMAAPASEASVDAVALDCIMITSDLNFVPPTDGLPVPNVFQWQTNASSIGEHTFIAQVKQASHLIAEATYTVNVTASSQTSESVNYSPDAFNSIVLPTVNLPAEPEDISLRLFPTNTMSPGICDFGGLPFEIAEFDEQAYFLALFSSRNEQTQQFPKQVMIAVNSTAQALAFLHAQFGSGSLGEQTFSYRIHFDDGTSLDIPIVEGDEICGTLKSTLATNAINVYRGFNGSINTKVYLMIEPLPADRQCQKITAVEAISSENSCVPVILGLGLLTDLSYDQNQFDNADSTADVTVDFGNRHNTIAPTLFGSNDQEAVTSRAPVNDELYQQMMTQMDMAMVRIHLGRAMNHIFPDPNSEADFSYLSGLERTFRRADRANQHILFCFAHSPLWVDLAKPQDRDLYADRCMQVVRYLLQEKEYPITHWQLFNEPYGGGISEDRGYWHFYNLLAQQIHAFDTHAKVGGPVLCWPDIGIIEDFLQYCAEQTDFVAWHWYPTGSSDTPTETLMQRTDEFATRSQMIRKLAKQYIPDREVELALTEYNVNYDWHPHDPRQATHVGACWAASVLKHLADVDHEIALSWHSIGGGTFGLIGRDLTPRPFAALLMLMNRYYAGAVRVDAVSGAANVEALAAETPDHYIVMLVNKSDYPQQVNLTALNGPTGTGTDLSRPVTSYQISAQDDLYSESRVSLFEHHLSQATIEMSAYSVQFFAFSRN